VGALLREIGLQPQSLPPIAGALLQLALALFLIASSGERRVRWAFALVSVCAAVWSCFTGVALATARPRVAQLAIEGSLSAIAFAGPLSYEFGTRLARVESPWRWISPLLSLSVAVAIIGHPSLLIISPRPDGGFWPRPSLGFLLVFVACVPSVFLAFWVLWRASRRLPPSRRRRQLTWAASAILVGGLGGLDTHTIFDGGYPLGWLTSTASCAILFYAIVQYRLMAIRTAVQRMAVVLAGALALAGWAGVMALGFVMSGRQLSPALVAAWVVAGFAGMRLWTSQIDPALLRLFDAGRRKLERALTEFERAALDARTREDVMESLRTTVENALGARLVSHLDIELAEPLLGDLVDLDQQDAAVVRAGLQTHEADALVPVGDGAIALAGGALVNADDELAELLDRLGDAARRAFTNARLYHEVGRRSAGLEAQVRVRTRELETALHDLTLAQAKLAEAERSSALGLLVAGVSHEIGNALNFISANLPTLGRYLAAYDSLLERHPPVTSGVAGGAARIGEAQKSAPATLGALGEAMKRTSAIVEDLRKFARPDTERRLFRVTEGLDAALNLLRRKTDGRLDVARSYHGPGMVEGYPGPLNQCFFNLLLNAIEAARGEIWIDVTDDEKGVDVLICDDGEGVPKDLVEQVFEPLFTTRPKAAGLGLSVSRAIVERHGGSLSLASDGGGARVHVHLPARAPEMS
jgi:signal transduction histidine kinase